MGKFVDLTGMRYGKLTVIKSLGIDKWRAMRWLCKCDCGTELVSTSSRLNYKHKMCLNCQKENLKVIPKTHGQSYSKTYTSWDKMLTRCYKSSDPYYEIYGGRGIKVCDKWKDFKNFYRDMGDRPEGYSLDRIDCNGDYYKENCRWADKDTQNGNKRNNLLLTYNGKTQAAFLWAKEIGLTMDSIYYRIRQGWSVEKIITTPLRNRNGSSS